MSNEQKDKAQETLFLAEIIISSMTLKERANPKLLKQPRRKQRIIKGSGRNAQDLINYYVNTNKWKNKWLK